MSQIKVQGNASGTGVLTVTSPNTNTNQTLTLPDGTGTFTVNGVNSNIVSGTAQASTGGTSIDFTSIPSWVKRITVMFNGVSTNGTANILIRIGSGSFLATGYLSAVGRIASAGPTAGTTTETTAFLAAYVGASSDLQQGAIVLTNISSNSWVAQGSLYSSGYGVQYAAGAVSLSGTLDRVRIVTSNGTDTFDAGTINILYE